MKRNWLFLLMFGLCAQLVQARTPRYEKRLSRQQTRLEKIDRKGRLSAQEKAKLEAQHHYIKQYLQAAQSNGRLGWLEKVKVFHELNQADHSLRHMALNFEKRKAD